MLRATGEGLSKMDYPLLKSAFKKILDEYPIENIRFWGKIFGTKDNYYVIECQPADTSVFEDEKAESVTENNESDKEEENEGA